MSVPGSGFDWSDDRVSAHRQAGCGCGPALLPQGSEFSLWKGLKAEGILRRRVRLRPCKYLNNVVEQDHRTVKKRTWLAKGYGLILHSVADVARNRSRAHDPEEPGEMGSEGGRDSGRQVYR